MSTWNVQFPTTTSWASSTVRPTYVSGRSIGAGGRWGDYVRMRPTGLTYIGGYTLVATSYGLPVGSGVDSVISLISAPATVTVQVNDISVGTCGQLDLYTVDTIVVDGAIYHQLFSGSQLTVIKAVYRVQLNNQYCSAAFSGSGAILVTGFSGTGALIAVTGDGTITANIRVRASLSLYLSSSQAL